LLHTKLGGPTDENDFVRTDVACGAKVVLRNQPAYIRSPDGEAGVEHRW